MLFLCSRLTRLLLSSPTPLSILTFSIFDKQKMTHKKVVISFAVNELEKSWSMKVPMTYLHVDSEYVIIEVVILLVQLVYSVEKNSLQLNKYFENRVHFLSEWRHLQ